MNLLSAAFEQGSWFSLTGVCHSCKLRELVELYASGAADLI